MELKDGVHVYHGSYITVQQPDLRLCKRGKDFGKGFYVTTNKSQAERFVAQAVRKARQENIVSDSTREGYVTEYIFSWKDSLKMYSFETANREWLHCVVGHRRESALPGEIKKWSTFDIITGKIANDYTNLVITVYLEGLYGEILSEEADQTAIRNLEPEKLVDQSCFRTETALQCLSFVGEERIRL